jgi:hypothetical protein
MNIRQGSYFEEFLNTIQKNTEINNHTENCMLIAVNFGNEIQKEEMRAIQKDHDEKKELTCITSIARKYLTDSILFNMQNKMLSKAIKNRL